MILTTSDIAGLPMGDFFVYSREVSELCRNKKLYGYKDPSKKNFASWQIPHESLALYLKYNPVIKQAFMEMDVEGMGERMNKITKLVRQQFNRGINSDDIYSAKELAEIMSIPENQIFSIFVKNYGLYRIPWIKNAYKTVKRIPIIEVIQYLRSNPQQYQKLIDRQGMLLASGKEPIMEEKVRHILMLYMYYDTNGYLL